MSIARLLTTAGLLVIEDVRAKRRVTDAPESIHVRYHDTEDTLQAIGENATIYPAPLAVILQNGQVVVLSDGGKGGIVVQGSKETMTEEQTTALGIVSEALCKHYGVGMEGATKRKSKKEATSEPQTAPEAEDGATVPTEPESPVDGDTEANGGESA